VAGAEVLQSGFEEIFRAKGATKNSTAATCISNFIATKLQQVKLLQAEQQTLGKEIAYIVKAKETF
jgi:hypothetical protein